MRARSKGIHVPHDRHVKAPAHPTPFLVIIFQNTTAEISSWPSAEKKKQQEQIIDGETLPFDVDDSSVIHFNWTKGMSLLHSRCSLYQQYLCNRLGWHSHTLIFSIQNTKCGSFNSKIKL